MRTLIITLPHQLPHQARIWGTAGWIPPAERESLDWLVLVRSLGWEAVVTYPQDLNRELATLADWDIVIVACDPRRLEKEAVSGIEKHLYRRPCFLISRVSESCDATGSPWWPSPRNGTCSGQRLAWRVPQTRRDWTCRKRLTACQLNVDIGAEVLSTLDGAPIITQKRLGAGLAVTLGLQPSSAAETSAETISLLRTLLTCGVPAPQAWLDLSGTLVLRMDDPGGAQNVYSRNWSYRKLDRFAWRQVGKELAARHARMSAAYVCGWVDDGHDRRGDLRVAGTRVPRTPGTIHPTPLVDYHDLAGNLPGLKHDYRSEYDGLQDLRKAGLVDVEMHGFTHICADIDSWLRASDRYENRDWFRDFSPRAIRFLARLPRDEHPLNCALAAFRQYFNTFPTTLICPGDEWTNDVLERALVLDLQLVNSYYLAIRHSDRFCWASHICAPYLDEAASKWFLSGLPVIGYFHDYEVATEGPQWMAKCLESWQQSGARRLIDFRELAAALATRVSLEVVRGETRLRLAQPVGIPFPRPLPICVRMPEGDPPETLLWHAIGEVRPLPIQAESRGIGQVLAPCTDAFHPGSGNEPEHAC